MIERLKIEHILFLDIETVPLYASFEEVPETEQLLWADKTRYLRKDEFSAKDFYERAGIWAEFGKIVCISVGYFTFHENRAFRVTSFYDEEETLLLKNFKNLLETHFSKTYHLLCAHNGKEFDFPYIARRMLINHIALPKKLNLFGKKPWEVPHLDTLELWKFGDYKHYSSLKLLTHLFGIPSPKTDIDGSKVGEVFYKENDIQRIVRYCESDVVAVAQLLLQFKTEPLLNDEEILYVD